MHPFNNIVFNANNDEKVAFLKNIPNKNSKLKCKSYTLFETNIAKIRKFLTKTAKNHNLWGHT